MSAMNNSPINDNDLFFTCSLIEYMGRTLKQRRGDLARMMGEKILLHIYEHSDTLHCEPIAKTADAFTEICNLTEGSFDNVTECKYAVPSYWDIGKVYARLIEDVYDGDLTGTMLRVYDSEISDAISNYNSDFFYQPRDYIKVQFQEGKVVD